MLFGSWLLIVYNNKDVDLLERLFVRVGLDALLYTFFDVFYFLFIVAVYMYLHCLDLFASARHIFFIILR